MVGLLVASVVFAGSLVAALFNLRWGTIGYAAAIYAAFAVMGISSWSIRVRKNEAWEDLNQLDQYVLNRHRVSFTSLLAPRTSRTSATGPGCSRSCGRSSAYG